MRLAGKRALITGGGTGIGRATAELFAREGAAVTVSGRRHAELEETVRRVRAAGGTAALVQGDVASAADAERMVREGVFLVSRFAVAEMVRAGRGGSVVHVSSVAGIVGDPKLAPYNAAKGGVNLLTKNMALDYAPHGIRVNAVCPGRIWTPMPQSRLKPEDDPQEILARWGKNIPLGRVGMPEDVASAILFLASDESAWITGTWLVVDGGATACHPPIG